MADSTLASLTEDTAPLGTDWFYKVNSAGTADRKVAGSNLPKAFSPAWTSYTPTWTAITTNPTIGNGTLSGAYLQLGKLVFFRVKLTMGSTSTAGSGTWEFTLPVSAAAGYSSGDGFNLSGHGEDAGVVGISIDSGRIVDGTKFWMNVSSNSSATSGATIQIAHNVPFSWATGDHLEVSGFYEAA